MPRKSLRYSILEGKYIQEYRDVIRSEVTRREYERRLCRFLENISETLDSFIEKAKNDPAWLQDLLLGLIRKEKQRIERKEIEAQHLKNFLKPIRLLTVVFEFNVNWKKLGKMLPVGRRYALDRAPTVEELRRLVSSKDARFKAIILMMVSGGFRVGSWNFLKIRDVEPIKKKNEIVAAKLTIYRNEPEQYFTFISREAYEALETYLESRRREGKTLGPNSPLIASLSGEEITGIGVTRLFERTLWELGIRKEKKRRHDFTMHSIRKFFKTRCEQIMKPINVELLMGHSIGISDHYYRPTENELLEDYLKAEPLLSISEAEEVRRESELSRHDLEERLKQLEDSLSALIAEKGQINPSPDHSHTDGTSRNNTPKKVVKSEEIEKMMAEGWEPMMTIPDGRVVMKMA